MDSRERRRITKAPTYDRAPLSVPGKACRAGEDTPFLSSSDGLGSGIRKTEFSSDGSLLAVVGSNSNVALYDVATATRRLVPRRVPPS